MTNERNQNSGKLSKIIITLSGLLGLAAPITLAATTNPDYSNTFQTGVYFGTSLAIGVFTTIAGIHMGANTTRKYLNPQQQ